MEIKRIINVETVSHSIMFIASIASAFNIGEYLNESHNTITAYGLAFALGFGVMTLSTILSRVNP